jgi:hypothetical protein
MAAKKKRIPIASRLERAVSDLANAASVAATGSEIGVLELAVEDEIKPRTVRKRRSRIASRTELAAKKSRNPVTRKRPLKRGSRQPAKARAAPRSRAT